jgi:hypothetical protein
MARWETGPAAPTAVRPLFKVGTLVMPEDDVAGIQNPQGELVPVDRLGPGIVRALEPDGTLRVRWSIAGFDSWEALDQVRTLGPQSRLITLMKLGKSGRPNLAKQQVVSDGNVTHNWVVEQWPDGLVRALRPDGYTWTFEYKMYRNQLEFLHTMDLQPPEEDDAEALAAAEMVVLKERLSRRFLRGIVGAR